MSFGKIFDLTAGVCFHFLKYIWYLSFSLCRFISWFWKQSAVPTSVLVRIRRDYTYTSPKYQAQLYRMWCPDIILSILNDLLYPATPRACLVPGPVLLRVFRA